MNLTWIENFFLVCAGGDKALLDKDKIPIEYNKLVGIGATVFLTSVYAFIAMSYTITWLTDNNVIVLTLGLFWGAAIFNIDRLIVSTTYKKTFLANADILQLLFRIALTVLIALTISVPLEIKLFEPELIEILKSGQKEGLLSDPELIKIQNLKDDYHRIYLKEINDGLGGRRATTGKVSKEWERKEEEERQRYEKRYEELIELIESGNNNKFGFVSMYGALEVYKKDDRIEKISSVITLLLLMFELTPVLIKVTTERGNYDERIESLIMMGRINNQRDLEQCIETVKLKNLEMPKTYFSHTVDMLEKNRNKNIFKFISDYVKGKGVDIAIAVLMGIVLTLMKTDIKFLPSIGAIMTFVLNQYLLPNKTDA